MKTATDRPPDRCDSLSPRESEVLRLFSCGKCGKEIAADLGIQYHTVGTYKKRIMQKLRLKNHSQFLITAVKLGFSRNGGVGRNRSR